MCKELEELIKLGVAEGRAEGRTEGRAAGRAEGRAEGRAAGRVEGRVEGRAEGKTEIQRKVAIALDRRGMHLDEIAEITGAQVATIRIWLDKDLNPIKE